MDAHAHLVWETGRDNEDGKDHIQVKLNGKKTKPTGYK